MSDIETKSTISSITEKMYDMTLLEEYDFLFGNPLHHEIDEILLNVNRIKLLKEEIIILMHEILIIYFKNISEKVNIEEIKVLLRKIDNIKNIIHELKVIKK
jgi:hypothetical protein